MKVLFLYSNDHIQTSYVFHSYGIDGDILHVQKEYPGDVLKIDLNDYERVFAAEYPLVNIDQIEWIKGGLKE